MFVAYAKQAEEARFSLSALCYFYFSPASASILKVGMLFVSNFLNFTPKNIALCRTIDLTVLGALASAEVIRVLIL